MVMGGNILVVAGEDKTSRAGLLVRALVTVCRLACVCQEALQKQANFGGAGGKGEKSLAEHGGSNASQYGALQYILLIATAGPLLAVYALKLEPLGDPTHLSVLVDSFNVSFCWYLCLLL